MASVEMKDLLGGDELAPEEPLPAAEEDSSELPPGFQEAFDEYQAAPTADAMYRMIEACKGGSGLDLLVGKPKGK